MSVERTYPEIDDAELMAAYVRGDVSAMDALVARYRQPLFAWFLGMSGNRADAEDLFQDCWFRVIRSAERFSDISFKAWLWRIARNLVIDLRRKKKPDTSLDVPFDMDGIGDGTTLGDLIPAATYTPGQEVELADMRQRVRLAVASLTPGQREVFLMRTEAGLPFNEIARQLDIPLNTALGRMHDALGKLKGWLNKEASGRKPQKKVAK
ncbi:MAG: sigma-70 family RNA polymerase sigma factor [Kiritimatiellae bacterium]|nr:sigma-70 family RNA polymerase sigma factor [Kiritimatiellia bacterium]